uniref:Uncharacterized protein LOC103936436 n=1 Tax=Rhizophora mucronata TaxID=61149 RepID=A0A2P2MVL5_RHIMU
MPMEAGESWAGLKSAQSPTQTLRPPLRKKSGYDDEEGEKEKLIAAATVVEEFGWTDNMCRR